MAAFPSSWNPNTATTTHNAARFGPDPPPISTTTFVQADPSTFRALVQELTGASSDPSIHKLPVTYPNRLLSARTGKGEFIGPRRPAFKLQERRQSGRKLEITLQNINGAGGRPSSSCISYVSASPRRQRMMSNYVNGYWGFGGGGEMAMAASPVSTLDYLVARGMMSPRTPMSAEELEERGIAEKGYFLHPSPPGGRGSGRGSDPPELLTLFPLHSSSASASASASPP